MNLRLVYMVNAILGVIFGLAFLFIPDTLVDAYGLTLDESGILLGRLLGAAYIGLAAVAWLVKDHAKSPAGTNVTTAFFIGTLVSTLTALIGQLSGIVNALGWSTVVIFLLFTLAFGYYRFMKPA